MKFHSTLLEGAYHIELEPRHDDRGFFARAFCSKELSQAGLEPQFVQINNSFTRRKGTLRGMHYQLPPSAEVKIVRCIRGALHDVIIDLRPDSPSFGQWLGADLTADNRRMLYVPRGFAHGFLTTDDNTEVLYLCGAFYSPEHERGLRFDDPRFKINWPFTPLEISQKDQEWPYYDPTYHGIELMRGLS